MTGTASERRHEFDWIRVWATLVVFLYHSSRFFNQGDWMVKNADTYVWVEIWVVFASGWLMPLFFVISGVSLYYAIKKYEGWRNFYVDKFLRLMVPVIVASLTHSALHVYLDRVTHGQFSGSFFSFVPEYFTGLYLGVGSRGNFAFHGSHLWYLMFLFCHSMMCYRLFVRLQRRRSVPNLVAALIGMPGVVYICFTIPLLIMEAVIPEEILGIGAGSWGFLYYLWFFIAGFIIVSSERLQQNIMRQRWISLFLGAALAAVYLFWKFDASRTAEMIGDGRWPSTLIYFLSTWCWLFAVLGFGMRLLKFDRPWLRHANEAVLPFYILHQSVLLAAGHFIMRWEIHDFLKWMTVFAGSFLIVMAVYIFAVREFGIMRFLFGMKTGHPVSNMFKSWHKMIIPLAAHVGLIVFAVNQASTSISPMPKRFDQSRDIILDAGSITDRSPTGVHVLADEEALSGRALEFFSGANIQTSPHPEVYVEMRFSAPAGRYRVWVRGKSDMDGWSDSIWLQVDGQIGTRWERWRMGNWLDVHPAGVYAWAGDGAHPVVIVLKKNGFHRLRIQPRQTPHRIDQIWLSPVQYRIPDTLQPAV